MKIGSLFSGVGGLDMGVQSAVGGELAWHVEYEAAPSKVLEHHWPTVPNYGDVTTVDWATVEPIDTLTAGYPCQPFSLAGKRKGSNDDRHLWPYVLDAIRHLRPGLVVLENVRGHLSLGFGRVLGDLATAGYDAEWICIPASEAGAPHRRERIFIAAHPHDIGHEWSGPARDRRDGSADDDRSTAHPSGVRAEQGVPVAERRTEGAHGSGVAVERGSDDPRTQWGEFEPAIRRWEGQLGRPAPAPRELGKLSARFTEWLMGLPAGHVTDPAIGLTWNQQLKALGNGVVPQQAALALSILLAVDRPHNDGNSNG